MKREYGNTFLTMPRWFTDSEPRAERSIFQWGPRHEGGYGLSMLGVINGPMSRLGWVLAVHVSDDDGLIQRYTIKRRRWR